MKVLCLPRRMGKTTKLLERAKDYNGYIVCANGANVKSIMGHAKKIGVSINEPLTFRQLLEGKARGQKVWIDEVGLFVDFVCSGTMVWGVTISDYELTEAITLACLKKSRGSTEEEAFKEVNRKLTQENIDFMKEMGLLEK